MIKNPTSTKKMFQPSFMTLFAVSFPGACRVTFNLKMRSGAMRKYVRVTQSRGFLPVNFCIDPRQPYSYQSLIGLWRAKARENARVQKRLGVAGLSQVRIMKADNFGLWPQARFSGRMLIKTNWRNVESAAEPYNTHAFENKPMRPPRFPHNVGEKQIKLSPPAFQWLSRNDQCVFMILIPGGWLGLVRSDQNLNPFATPFFPIF